MKKIGIVGGIGPESTLMYYRDVVTRIHAQLGDDQYPEVVIESVNMTKMLSYFQTGDFDGLADFLSAAIDTLARSDASFAAIASNTPHLVFDTLQKRSAIPLISIVETTAEQAQTLSLKRLLLTGTGFTMKASFFADVFARYGIGIVTPSLSEIEEIHNIIFPELENGIVRPEKRERFLEMTRGQIASQNLDGIILGCTELPLIAGAADFTVPVLDTAQIHIESIVAEYFS